ncbi:MAG: YbaN family protein [Bacteroidales bacterium]|nr:YbaN family protein [Bacteroidales bacterium]
MRLLLAALGLLSLGLGILGIFLPVLPTTPLLLLAAALFFRSSPRLYDWLLEHPKLGPYIKNFREHKAIPLKIKVLSVSLVWLTLLNCAIFVADHWAFRLFFILLAAAITAHILHYKTLR